MVHILRYKIDDTVQYLIVGAEPTVKELKGMGHEYFGDLNVPMRGQYGSTQLKGRYSSTQLKKLLNSISEKTEKELESVGYRMQNLEERKTKIKEILDKLE